MTGKRKEPRKENYRFLAYVWSSLSEFKYLMPASSLPSLDSGIIHSYFLKSSLNCALHSWVLSIRMGCFYAFTFFRAYWFIILYQALKLILQNTICSIYSQKDAILKGLQFSRLAFGESLLFMRSQLFGGPQQQPCLFSETCQKKLLRDRSHPLVCPKTSFRKRVTYGPRIGYMIICFYCFLSMSILPYQSNCCPLV